MVRRNVVTVITAILLVMAMAAPAAAKDMYMSKTSDRIAQAWWTQPGELPGVGGNLHEGYLQAVETTSGKAWVWGYVVDWQCDEGEVPGGGHGEFEGGCDLIGFRDIYSEAELDFSLDRKLSSATLTGRVTVVGGHGGGPEFFAQPMVNMTWTGVGALQKNASQWRWTDGTNRYQGRYTSTDRSATVSGNIGPMGFDPAASGGWMSAYKMMDRSMSR